MHPFLGRRLPRTASRASAVMPDRHAVTDLRIRDGSALRQGSGALASRTVGHGHASSIGQLLPDRPARPAACPGRLRVVAVSRVRVADREKLHYLQAADQKRVREEEEEKKKPWDRRPNSHLGQMRIRRPNHHPSIAVATHLHSQ